MVRSTGSSLEVAQAILLNLTLVGEVCLGLFSTEFDDRKAVQNGTTDAASPALRGAAMTEMLSSRPVSLWVSDGFDGL